MNDESRGGEVDLSTRQGLEAALLARRRGRKQAAQVTILSRDGPLPLSPAQRSLWFASLVSKDASAHNVVQAERLRGPVDAAALQGAFDDLVERQEVLRLRIDASGTMPQFVAAEIRPRLEIVDMTAVAAVDRWAAIEDLVDNDARRPFDLMEEVPVRAALYRFAEDDALLSIIVHHISCDEWSMRTLRSDLGAFYRARRSGAAHGLPELTAQFADLAAQAAVAEAGRAQVSALDRWAESLDGARPDDCLPASADALAHPVEDGMAAVRMEEAMTAALDASGREFEATPFMAMLAASLCFMHRETGRRDITIATQVAGRVGAEAANLVGLFTNTVLIRSRLEGRPDFRQVLASVREQVRDAVSNQTVLYETLAQRLHVARNPDRGAFAHTMFTHRQSFEALQLDAGVVSESLSPRSRRAKHDVWISVIDERAGRMLRLIYDGERHDAAQMAGYRDGFVAFIAQLLSDPLFDLREGVVEPEIPDEAEAEGERDAAGEVDAETLAAVAALWSETLGGVRSEPDASFFEEGGDSLLLLQLAHRIETALGIKLSLADVFSQPTIRHLAAHAATRFGPVAPLGEWDRLIEPLSGLAERSDARPRYYLVAGGGGHVAPFSNIARRIEARWQGLGVLDPALFPDEAEQPAIETLAARMAEAIRSVDPEGPWLLAGYSAGGRTVYEIARQLRGQGGHAGCVILDAGVSRRTPKSEAIRMMRQLKRLGRVAVRRVSDGIAARRIKDDMAIEMQRRRYRRITDMQHGRLLKYHAPRTDTPVALVRAMEGRRGRKRTDQGWSRFARLLEVFDTPGDHYTCFKGENVPQFADALDRALTRVQDTITSDVAPARHTGGSAR